MVDCSLMAIKTIAYIEINPYLCSGIVRYVIKGNAKLLFKGFNNDELDIITQANVSPNPILAGEQVQINQMFPSPQLSSMIPLVYLLQN